MAETNIAIRFSVEDEETVRQALENLGKDGQKALERLNAALDKPGQGLKAVDSIAAGVKDRLTGLAVPLGPIGQGLIQLGPAGMIAAAGIGAVVSAMTYMTDEAHHMGETAQQVQLLADVSGLSAEQVQSLVTAGGKLGLSDQQVTAGLERFTAQLNQVHEASGPLYDQLVRISPKLAQQMVDARDASTEWNLLAKAYALAGSEAERAALAQAAFGRNGFSTASLLGATNAQGGLAGLQQQNPANATNDEIRLWAQLQGTIAATKKDLQEAMASMWTEDVLQREYRALETLRSIVEQQRELKEQSGGSWWNSFWQQVAQGLAAETGQAPLPPQTEAEKRAAGLPRGNLYQAGSYKLEQAFKLNGGATFAPDMSQFPGYQPAPTQNLQRSIASANTLAAQMQILGPAATSAEQLALKFAQIDALVAKTGGQYQTLGDRAKQAAQVQVSAADLAIRVENNVATAEDLRAQRANELQLLVARGKLTQDEATRALQTYEKTVEQTIAAEQVRSATLPGLKQLELDAADIRKQLDQTGTQMTSGLVTGLADIPFASDGASASLKRLEQQMARTALQAALMATVGRTSASIFQAIFSALIPGSGGIPLSLGNIGGTAGNLPALRAAGGPVDAGSWAIVGERGFELMHAHPGGGVTVYSNPVSRGMLGFAAGGGFDRYGNTTPSPAFAGGMALDVQINNYGSDNVDARMGTGPNGQPRLEVIVGQITDRNLARGRHDAALTGRFNTSRQTLRRG